MSTAADACPHCGHPNRQTAQPTGPKCYACSASATTRCVRCGALSCALHLRNVNVAAPNSLVGRYELLCESCYLSVEKRNILFVILFILVVIGTCFGMPLLLSHFVGSHP